MNTVISKVDRAALTTALLETAVVMMAPFLPCMILVTLIAFSITNFIIWWVIVGICTTILTTIFYKYERAVDEEDQ